MPVVAPPPAAIVPATATRPSAAAVISDAIALSAVPAVPVVVSIVDPPATVPTLLPAVHATIVASVGVNTGATDIEVEEPTVASCE